MFVADKSRYVIRFETTLYIYITIDCIFWIMYTAYNIKFDIRKSKRKKLMETFQANVIHDFSCTNISEKKMIKNSR